MPWGIQVSILEIENILYLKILYISYYIYIICCYPIIPILVFTCSIVPY